MINIFKRFSLLIFFISYNTSPLISQIIDLSKSKIICLEKKDPLVLNSISILQEEISKRSGIQLIKGSKFSKQSRNLIVVGLEEDLDKFPPEYGQLLDSMSGIHAEGYKIAVLPNENVVLVVGHDSRGVLYGVGKLLRKMQMHP